MRKRRLWLWIPLALVILAGLYLGVGYLCSRTLEATRYSLAFPSRTGITSTVRVAQVSDLHLAVFGEENQALVDLVASKQPDIILSTGDMIDVRAEGIDATVDLFRRLREIAPVLYSLGNHEVDRDDLAPLLRALDAEDIEIVHNNAVTVDVNGQSLRIGGVYHATQLFMLDDDGEIDILLCHFPHELAVLADYGIPLTFSGHTHGGQFRIPLLDIALYAPNQGWFPKYTVGVYRQDFSYMVVSRGLGNSSFPFRVFNPPEVVIADITYTNEVEVIR